MAVKLINVDKDGNCGFLSIAALLLDARNDLTTAIDDGVFDDLVALYQKYYPQQFPQKTKLTTKQSLSYLIQTYRSSEILPQLAYVLRQDAVDTIVKEPAKYIGAFADITENTNPAEMRKSGTWIDAGAITAIAQKLHLPITVDCGRFKAIINDDRTYLAEPLVMQLDGNHYRPYVKYPAYFEDAKEAVQAIPQKHSSNDPSMAEILQKIRQAEELDLAREQEASDVLSQCSLVKLLCLFQKTATHSEYLTGKVTAITREHGGDLFFYNAIRSNKIEMKRQSEITAILIQALAKQAYIDPSFDPKKALQTLPPVGATQTFLNQGEVTKTCREEVGINQESPVLTRAFQVR